MKAIVFKALHNNTWGAIFIRKNRRRYIDNITEAQAIKIISHT